MKSISAAIVALLISTTANATETEVSAAFCRNTNSDPEYTQKLAKAIRAYDFDVQDKGRVIAVQLPEFKEPNLDQILSLNVLFYCMLYPDSKGTVMVIDGNMSTWISRIRNGKVDFRISKSYYEAPRIKKENIIDKAFRILTSDDY